MILGREAGAKRKQNGARRKIDKVVLRKKDDGEKVGENTPGTRLLWFVSTVLRPSLDSRLKRPGHRLEVGSTVFFNGDWSFHFGRIGSSCIETG